MSHHSFFVLDVKNAGSVRNDEQRVKPSFRDMGQRI